MNTIEQKIAQLKKDGFQLDFEEVINKAFENYRKIALYAGLVLFVVSFLLIVALAFSVIAAFGIENINKKSILLLEIKMRQPEYLLYQSIGIAWFSAICSPFSASLLLMADYGNKDIEFKSSQLFSFYKPFYFKNLVVLTIITSIFTIGITEVLDFFGYSILAQIISLLFSVLTFLAVPLVIFGKQTAIAALSTSIHLCKTKIPLLFAFIIISALGALVGLFALFIGVFFTIPFVISMQYAIYDTIIGVEVENKNTTNEASN